MIAIVSYDSSWPDRFSAFGSQLRESLGDLAVRIDHIGSTAVPGLSAKDLIDIQITARCLEPSLEQALRAAGFKRIEHIMLDHVPPGGCTNRAEWSKWFFRHISPDVAVNLHVRLDGRANQRYPILFRDYLRAHPPTAAAYAQVKQALVLHRFDNPDAYYDVKDPVCDIIMAGAEAWSAATAWKPGRSDC